METMYRSSSSHPLFPLLLSLFLIFCSLIGERSWRNNIQSLHFMTPSVSNDALVRPILLSANTSYNKMNLQFGCGFFCYGSPCETGFLFATFIFVYTRDGKLLDMQMVWSANREQMVQANAVVTLTSTGELVLRDSDDTLVWSTNTSSQAFQRMAMEDSGNLVLYNTSHGIIWQSFDYSTDTVLRGQKFKVGQKIIASISPTNTSQGRFYGTLLRDGFAMFTASAPARLYYRFPEESGRLELSYTQFDDQNNTDYSEGKLMPVFNFSTPNGTLYNKLDSDGILRAYSFEETKARSGVKLSPLFMKSVPECETPVACGDYGVCTKGQCSCPRGGDAFRPIDVTKWGSHGCAPRVPLVCSQTSTLQDHQFLELEHVAYFTYLYENSSAQGLISGNECKTLCLKNCSCKAAFFRYETKFSNFSGGYCYLESNVYSMTTMSPEDDYYDSIAYIKIQSSSKGFKSSVVVVTCASIGGAIALSILVWAWLSFKSQKSRQKNEKDDDDDDDGHVDWPEGGLPLRYTLQELKDATNNFSIKLGSGGFGSVYEGVWADGSKIAVKRLDGAGRGKREFRAEIETLGKVDHVNLVRLKGFCTEKADRLLVYEHLPNGSLDKWIFSNNIHQYFLEWKSRYKIVLNIARGLTYLHEDCRQRIIHFDIKPQNILLDQNFNAKISDFGLAKLVNREQSEVITMLRGTPGYMAPELLNFHFTEKADVFSFGVMMVEIVSGKRSREVREKGLFLVLKVKADEGRLVDLFYPGLEDEITVGVQDEAIKVLKLAMWCVRDNFTRRPAMSIVVKALEGLVDEFNDIPSELEESIASSFQHSAFSSELCVLSGGE